MNEYTPDTGEVRELWAAFSEYGGIVDRPASTGWDDYRAEFDRWLAAHDKEVAADAWGEGYEAGQHNEHEHRIGHRLTNPYRSEP